ncbi:MAG: Ig-like domain-containing protein [Prolixibacteraceae bacterium]|nr:Ig-like domain-containing protein [Prolixibacteraceae bacterium]
MVKRFVHIVASVLVPLLLVYSCANMGMPKGGPKDKAAPFIVKSIPENNQLNFKDNKIRISFDEFVVPDEMNEKFIVSPPTTKKPIFKTKGKTFIVDLNEKLRPNTTYSLDFKDGIVDNNEKNRYKNLRLAFSTGPTLDSLRIVGFVRDAFTLEPSKNCFILLYKGSSDTLVHKTRPDFIGKTNAQGFFAVTNLPKASYLMYALSDIDNNLKYTSGVDSIAFLGSRIEPSAEFQPQRDTVVTGADTLVVLGKTRFYPDPINFSLFFEKGFDLNLDKYERPNRKTIDLTFTGSTADTFNIEVLNVHPKGPWNIIEKSKKSDTLKIWLTDSLVYKRDTLALKLSYLQQDSLGHFFTKKDTIKLYLSDSQINKPEKEKRKERRKIVTEQKSVTLTTNLGSILDTYRDVQIESPEPILSFDTSLVGLFVKKDTSFYKIPPKIRPDPVNHRRFLLSYPWEFGTSYKLTIDSTALHTIYGMYGKALKNEFRTQEEEHYGKIIYFIKNVKGPTIIQLLENSATEKLMKSVNIDKDGEITIPFLEPQKYLMKAIFDRNKNGVWDSGNLKEKLEPEEVCYNLNVIKVRSNWDNKNIWTLPDPAGFRKKIVDEEVEAEKLIKKKKVNNAPQRTKLF